MDSTSDTSWEFVYSSYSEFLNVAKAAIAEATSLEQQEKWDQVRFKNSFISFTVLQNSTES